ncbi:hypothetical protein NEOLEDRAFT_1074064 [Neolentinus lepideus HHB14362 ss-1]|uniref:RING-type E3 ubiquitin transferase n=1 Tax=Neolentinus lepideus HHB14362 ss-1 TaxID=1314782 RepID=A0A165PL07_9AGAM|nr:hypothetical protein NEOLEDRAFT_1074064 [Neolentinus lepideus HHB14362 ss-1]
MNAAGTAEPRERDEEAAAAPNPADPQRPRGSISSFIFISFILFLLTNHNGAELVAQNQYREMLRSYNWQLGNYSAWLNGTESNFTLPERDPLLEPLVHSFVAPGTELDPSTSSYYSNITGYIKSTIKFHNLTVPYSSNNSDTPLPPWVPLANSLMEGVNMTELVESVSLGGWNLSAPERAGWNGVEKLVSGSWRFNSSQPRDDIAMIHGRMDLSDPKTGDEFRVTFEGVHLIKNGSVYGLAEPGEISPDIRHLPAVVPQPYMNLTAQLVEPELAFRIARLKTQLDAGSIDFSTVISDDQNQAHPRCPLTLFLQLKPTSIPADQMSELEAELLKPTGITTVQDPGIKLEGVMVSKECGFVWELRDGEGVRSNVWYRMVTTYAGASALVYLCLLALLARQMNVSRTPTNLSRLSRWSFLTQALSDAIFFAGHITFAVVTDGQPSISLVAPAFLACLLFVYEAQFAIVIVQTQAPEDVTPTPPRQANNTGESAQEGQEGTLVVAAPSYIQRARSFYTRVTAHPQFKMWLTLALFVAFVIRISLYPPLALFVLGGMYGGLWVPQIYRSARRGRTSGLTAEYLLGTTAFRLAIAFYFLAYQGNVLDIEAKEWFWPVAALLLAEVLVIRLQEIFGPAFFLPKRLSTVPIYDYHPPMPLPDPEAPDQSLGDCAICLDAILIDPLHSRRGRSGDGKEPGDLDLGGLLNKVSRGAAGRKSYSLAPCHHLFHTECLERWLAIKNICPQCRRPLPPL